MSYDPWGTPTISGNTDNRLLWKGLMWEGDPVSLYYVRNRWYDPEVGRFVNEDPIGHAGGENLYTFANNDPVNASDPSGMNQLATIEVWANYYPELPKWGAAAEASLLSAFFAGGGGGGGGGTSGPAVRSVAPKKPERDWGKCYEEVGQSMLSGTLDYIGYKELQAARTAMGIGVDLVGQGTLRLARNGGIMSGHVLRDLRNSTTHFGEALGGYATFWSSVQERGLTATIPVDVVPLAGTAMHLFKAAKECLF